MSVYHPPRIPFSDVTPRDVYLSRRHFLGAAAGMAAIGLTGDDAVAAPSSQNPALTSLMKS